MKIQIWPLNQRIGDHQVNNKRGRGLNTWWDEILNSDRIFWARSTKLGEVSTGGRILDILAWFFGPIIFYPTDIFFSQGSPLMRKEVNIFNFILEKSLFNKKGVFLHLNLKINFQNWKKCILGIFWSENYISSYFHQVSDTCIFYKSGVKNNRTKKSS